MSEPHAILSDSLLHQLTAQEQYDDAVAYETAMGDVVTPEREAEIRRDCGLKGDVTCSPRFGIIKS